MATNLNNVNPQMEKLADNAVTAARDKFGVSLDFTENSLQQLETLLQKAHEDYKQIPSSGHSQNHPIETTVRVWGSYLGEVIRRSLGGDWIVDQKNVFLQLGAQKLDPLGQVRSRIVDVSVYNIQSFFWGLKQNLQVSSKNEPLVQKPISGNEIPLQTEKSIKNKCPFCGREFQGTDVIYCPNCGKVLGNASFPEPLKTKKCPYCAEEIQEAAIVCKHCGRDLGTTLSSNYPKKNMALVKCTDCGKEISSEAESCPHCGKPSSILHCPFCKSTNVMKKSTSDQVAHALGQIFGAGPFARPPKLYFCKNCKHEF